MRQLQIMWQNSRIHIYVYTIISLCTMYNCTYIGVCMQSNDSWAARTHNQANDNRVTWDLYLICRDLFHYLTTPPSPCNFLLKKKNIYFLIRHYCFPICSILKIITSISITFLTYYIKLLHIRIIIYLYIYIYIWFFFFTRSK